MLIYRSPAVASVGRLYRYIRKPASNLQFIHAMVILLSQTLQSTLGYDTVVWFKWIMAAGKNLAFKNATKLLQTETWLLLMLLYSALWASFCLPSTPAMLYHNVLPFCCIVTFKTVTPILTVSLRLSIKRYQINFVQKHWNYRLKFDLIFLLEMNKGKMASM